MGGGAIVTLSSTGNLIYIENYAGHGTNKAAVEAMSRDAAVELGDMGIRVNPHVVAGLSEAEGITFFSGLVMRWFRDAFCDLEKLEAKDIGIDVYTLLERKAKSVPIGSHGIMPIFSDSMKNGK